MNTKNNNKNDKQPLTKARRRRDDDDQLALTFSPSAWLKLQYFCHRSGNEIGGFGISSARDPLYVERFDTVMQGVSPLSVEFADSAVADHFDRCVDDGLAPERFARIWCHTHPGESAEPSWTDERTFDRVFSRCDWSVMFILARGGRTYARLAFSAGPGGSILLPVRIDWESWPMLLDRREVDPAAQVRCWQDEFESNVHVLRGLGGKDDRQSDLPYSLALTTESPEQDLWADAALELLQLEEMRHEQFNAFD